MKWVNKCLVLAVSNKQAVSGVKSREHLMHTYELIGCSCVRALPGRRAATPTRAHRRKHRGRWTAMGNIKERQPFQKPIMTLSLFLSCIWLNVFAHFFQILVLVNNFDIIIVLIITRLYAQPVTNYLFFPPLFAIFQKFFHFAWQSHENP